MMRRGGIDLNAAPGAPPVFLNARPDTFFWCLDTFFMCTLHLFDMSRHVFYVSGHVFWVYPTPFRRVPTCFFCVGTCFFRVPYTFLRCLDTFFWCLAAISGRSGWFVWRTPSMRSRRQDLAGYLLVNKEVFRGMGVQRHQCPPTNETSRCIATTPLTGRYYKILL